jgi:hypothetical protein
VEKNNWRDRGPAPIIIKNPAQSDKEALRETLAEKYSKKAPPKCPYFKCSCEYSIKYMHPMLMSEQEYRVCLLCILSTIALKIKGV